MTLPLPKVPSAPCSAPSVLFAPRSRIIEEYAPQRPIRLSADVPVASAVCPKDSDCDFNHRFDDLVLLLSGEKIISQIQAVSSSFTAGEWSLGNQGILFLTNFRLIFVPFRDLLHKDKPPSQSDDGDVDVSSDHSCNFLLNLTNIRESVSGTLRTCYLCRDCKKDGAMSPNTHFYDLGILSVPFGSVHDVFSFDPITLQTAWPQHFPLKWKPIAAGIFQIECKSFRSLLFLCLSQQFDFISEFQSSEESFLGSCGVSRINNSDDSFCGPQQGLAVSENLWGNLAQWWTWSPLPDSQARLSEMGSPDAPFKCPPPTPEDQQLFNSFSTSLHENCFMIDSSLFILNSFAFCFSLSRNEWKLYDIFKEFKRLKFSECHWQVSELNSDFALSPTYPKQFIIPQSVTTDVIFGTAKFRTKKRFPVVVWRSAQTGAVLVRCSQPLTGLLRSRSVEDEMLFESIGNSSSKDRLRKKSREVPITIFDCRPKLNAYANQAQGAGVEAIENYPGCRIEYLGIHNIHTMRDSLHKVHEICRQFGRAETGMNWLSSLEYTGWFGHIYYVLKGAAEIANCIASETPSNAVVHCSDGWDRTSQLVSLAEILLDPYYRSLEGFEVLIEKEWISFGHKFCDRLAIGKRGMWEENESGPIFLQWVECVWQIWNQFPCAFEFNCHFLIFLIDGLYSNLFGNFLFNSNKEREQHQVTARTSSIWSYVNSPTTRPKFVNPFYSPQETVLRPCVSMIKLRFWGEYYLRHFSFHSQSVTNEAQWDAQFSEATSQHVTLREQVRQLTETNRALEERNYVLQKELSQFKVDSHNTHSSGIKPNLSKVMIMEDYCSAE